MDMMLQDTMSYFLEKMSSVAFVLLSVKIRHRHTKENRPLKVCLKSSKRAATLRQRQCNVMRCVDLDATLYKSHVPAGV